MQAAMERKDPGEIGRPRDARVSRSCSPFLPIRLWTANDCHHNRIDLPPQLQNPIRNYQDVEEIVTRNWPNRESMIRAEGAEPTRFKRLLGLVVSPRATAVCPHVYLTE